MRLKGAPKTNPVHAKRWVSVVTCPCADIKSRTNNTIAKQRGGVKREALEHVLSGQLPIPGQMSSGEPAHRAAVEQFIHHMQELEAEPKAHVAYLREAWTSRHDNSVRVTLDRRVRLRSMSTNLAER